jgi:hypothetical protein
VTPLTVTLDVERAPWTDLRPRPGDDGTLARIGLLRHATVQGKAGVAVVIDMPDGTQVIGQTTWALFRTAYAALAASPVVAEEVVDP